MSIATLGGLAPGAIGLLVAGVSYAMFRLEKRKVESRAMSLRTGAASDNASNKDLVKPEDSKVFGEHKLFGQHGEIIFTPSVVLAMGLTNVPDGASAKVTDPVYFQDLGKA